MSGSKVDLSTFCDTMMKKSSEYITSYYCIPSQTIGASMSGAVYNLFKVGDRVELRDGYFVNLLDGSARGIYKGIDAQDSEYAVVAFEGETYDRYIDPAALKSCPYTTDEKAENLIADFVALTGIKMKKSTQAALHALLVDKITKGF